MKRRILFHGLWLLLFTAGNLHADILDQWHWRNPSPFANPLQSICFGDGKFVAVGAGGLIHISNDGLLWDDGRRPTTNSLNKVIQAGGQYVAVGNAGVILTSSDGNSWMPQNSGITNDLLGVAFGNGRYVACGAAGRIAVSTNGSNWFATNTDTYTLDWVAYGNGVFLLRAPSISSTQLTVQVSADGLDWRTASLPAETTDVYAHSLHKVEFANGLFLAVANGEGNYYGGLWPALKFFSSADGTNWLQGAAVTGFFPALNTHRALTVANGLFYEMIVNDSSGSFRNMFRTTDGNSTDMLVPANLPYGAADMTYGNGRYVLVAQSQSGMPWTSTDGTNWSSGFKTSGNTVRAMIQGFNGYLVLTEGSSQPIYASPDGFSFVPITGSPTGTFNALGFDGSNYVVVGESGFLMSTVGTVYTSTNSVNWTQRTSNAGSALTAICKGSSGWVAVGAGGTIISSPTAAAWTLRFSGTGNTLRSVAYGAGSYVAVGDGGTVITSANGAAWEVEESGTLSALQRVYYSGGRFLAVGANGTILNSTDGVVWQLCNSGVASSLKGITYGDGRFIVCGSGGTLLQSINAIDWLDISTKVPSAVVLNLVNFMGQSFALYGEGGSSLESDSLDGRPLLSGAILSGKAAYQIKFLRNVPQTYRVLCSTNLDSSFWNQVASITNPVPPHVWTDTNAANGPVRIYRVVSP